MNPDQGQYRPLTPSEILTAFQNIKTRLELLEKTLAIILRLNDLKYEEEPKKRTAKRGNTMAKKPMESKHDDIAEDKAMINKAIAKHDAKEHPGKTPTKIKKGGRAKAKK